jgi:hypothetical protein
MEDTETTSDVRITYGGLEPNDKDRNEIITINNTKFIISEKFKTMLRDSIIDWDTFLNVYNTSINNEIMLKQVQRLLDIHDSHTKDMEVFISALKKIYKMPLESHISHLINQFMIQEPMSYAIHGIFTTIKNYFESVFELFIEERNNYIIENDTKDTLNDYPSLLSSWKKINIDYNLETSSIKLLMLHPPKYIKQQVQFKIKGIDISQLLKKIKMFTYPGFCPRVPHKRLQELLKFPVNEFINIIYKLNPKIKFPNFKEIEKKALSLIEHQDKPKFVDNFEREKPPEKLVSKHEVIHVNDSSSHHEKIKINDKNRSKQNLQLVKWYVDKILLMRKTLVPIGSQYENYFINIAKQLNEVNKLLEKELVFDE